MTEPRLLQRPFSGPSNKTRSYLPVDMPRPPIRSLDFRAPADHHTIDFSFRSGDKTATSFQSSFDRQSCLDAPQLVLVDRQSPELGRTSLERPTPPRKPFTVTAEIKRDDTKLKSLPKPSAMNGLKALVAASWFNLLLVFVPISWSLNYLLTLDTPGHDTAVFITSFFAIISLAKFRSWAVGELTVRAGKPFGTLIATCFGNAVPFIIGIVALEQCNMTAVHNSLVGSILSNLLLILGTALLGAGRTGWHFNKDITFIETTTKLNTSLLLLSIVAILVPGTFHLIASSSLALSSAIEAQAESSTTSKDSFSNELGLSRGVAMILIVMYVVSLVFQSWSHAHMFQENVDKGPAIAPITHYAPTIPEPQVKFRPIGGPSTKPYETHPKGFGGMCASCSRSIESDPTVSSPTDEENASSRHFHTAARKGVELMDSEKQEQKEVPGPAAPLWMAIAVLIIVTGLVVNNVRFLINSMNGLADDTHGGLHHSWVALILLPLAGNVTDHVMTVSHTFKNDLDRAISLAFGGSVQMALLVIPFLVLLGWMIGKPLTLLFDPFQIIVLFVTTLSVSLVIDGGRNNWLDGMILISLYLIMAVGFWFYPTSAVQAVNCTR